ncbi:MAG: 3-phosphoglycerate dehydrogenase [Ruminococcaceae bacterium]|nr:3-phosphoglycerate dehydrogenase [Oscillospiraceae bacterium]
MFDVLTLNKIAPQGLEKFTKDVYNVTDSCDNPDGIILRSFSMHDMALPEKLKAVARAGAGVNNIPIEACTEKGIVVFNTPGANANAVKELVITGILLASRNVIGGVEWAKTLLGQGAEVPKLVEKGKGQFVGPEIKGKRLGVIGLGAIGVMVANAAHNLGMDVIGYDPYLTIDSAWHLSRSIHKAKDMNEVFANCDYITLHVPLNDSTKGMICAESLNIMKDGVRILNFSRGGLVNTEDLAQALNAKKVACYVTDFPDETVLTLENTIAIPHLGASTPESEENCAEMAAQELVDYLENGNITNSVNFPTCSVEREGKVRVTILHKNIPAMLSQFSAIFAEKHLNIQNMMNKNKKETAYTIMDIDGEVEAVIEEKLNAIDGVLRVRILR